jgi:MFS family permease
MTIGVWTNPRRRRWIGWAVLVTAFVLVSFHRVSTSVIADDLMRSFDATGTELGVLHSSLFYIYALLQVPAGVFADRFGTRRIAAAGTLLMSAGVVAFAASDGYALAFVSRSIIGLGGSVIYISTLKYCANWYRTDEFATITGATSAMAGIGGILATTPLAVGVTEFGWRTALAAVGVVGLGAGVTIFAGRPPLPVTGAMFFGATFVGGAGFITLTLVKDRHPAEASGSATGAVNSLGVVGVAALPVVMGWLLDAFWTGEVVDGARVDTALGYRAAFAVATTMGLVAVGGAIWYWWATTRRGDRG